MCMFLNFAQSYCNTVVHDFLINKLSSVPLGMISLNI